jgi:hypothetical protein
MFPIFVAFGLAQTTFWRSVAVGVVVSASSALLLAPILMFTSKRGWGEHAYADEMPPPTSTRPWTRTSDSFLLWTMILAALAFLISAADLATNARPCGDCVDRAHRSVVARRNNVARKEATRR